MHGSCGIWIMSHEKKPGYFPWILYTVKTHNIKCMYIYIYVRYEYNIVISYIVQMVFSTHRNMTETRYIDNILTIDESIFLRHHGLWTKAWVIPCHILRHMNAFGENFVQKNTKHLKFSLRFCNCQLGIVYYYGTTMQDYVQLWFLRECTPPKHHKSVRKVCNFGREERCSFCFASMGAEIQANFLLQRCTKSSLTSSDVSEHRWFEICTSWKDIVPNCIIYAPKV